MARLITLLYAFTAVPLMPGTVSCATPSAVYVDVRTMVTVVKGSEVASRITTLLGNDNTKTVDEDIVTKRDTSWPAALGTESGMVTAEVLSTSSWTPPPIVSPGQTWDSDGVPIIEAGTRWPASSGIASSVSASPTDVELPRVSFCLDNYGPWTKTCDGDDMGCFTCMGDYMCSTIEHSLPEGTDVMCVTTPNATTTTSVTRMAPTGSVAITGHHSIITHTPTASIIASESTAVSSPHGLTKSSISAIVLGSVLLISAVLVAISWYRRKRRNDEARRRAGLELQTIAGIVGIPRTPPSPKVTTKSKRVSQVVTTPDSSRPDGQGAKGYPPTPTRQSKRLSKTPRLPSTSGFNDRSNSLSNRRSTSAAGGSVFDTK